MSTSIKIIDFILDLAETNIYNAELRSRPDGLGYFNIKIKYINPKFIEIINKNKIEIINVTPSKVDDYIFVTLKFKND